MTGVTMHACGTLGLNAANPIISLARSIRVHSSSSNAFGRIGAGQRRLPIASIDPK
jgi:hypothetical protein